jgi:hypothetical protein
MCLEEVNATFEGERFIGNPSRHKTVTEIRDIDCFGNSGIGSIQLAIKGGAKRILLLGYDCQVTQGKTHWHGDHPKGLANARFLSTWPDKFRQFSKSVKVEIINCSRETALDCFPRMTLAKALKHAG